MIKRNIRSRIIEKILIKLDSLKPSKWIIGIQLGSGIINICAVVFLVLSIYNSKEQIKQANESIELQRLNIEKIDSSVVLLTGLTKLQQESIGQLNKFNLLYRNIAEFDTTKYIEENKPFIKLKNIDCELKDDTTCLYINYINTGITYAS